MLKLVDSYNPNWYLHICPCFQNWSRNFELCHRQWQRRTAHFGVYSFSLNFVVKKLIVLKIFLKLKICLSRKLRHCAIIQTWCYSLWFSCSLITIEGVILGFSLLYFTFSLHDISENFIYIVIVGAVVNFEKIDCKYPRLFSLE